MDLQHLIHMANQIGAFFEAMPDRGEAQEGTARHLRNFWEARMRRELLAYVDAGEGAVIAPSARAAAHAHADVEADGDEPTAPVPLSPFVREAIVTHRAIF